MADQVAVSDHYTVSDLGGRILAALGRAGMDVDALTVDDLAPVDAFHLRGRPATAELAAWADLRPEHRVLDVGSGLGGTARFLASTTGCRVTGVDLTEAYCRVAEMLSTRVGLADRTSFRPADATALPFDDGVFDVVWTEHVQMNIADKAGFYGEIARVLAPGGQLAFHDVFAGAGGAPHFPVPWASEATISHLASVEDVRAILAAAGLAETRWAEVTDEAIEFLRTTLERMRAEGPPAVGLHLLMGDDAGVRLGNVLRNLEEGRIRVAQAIMTRETPA